MFASGALELPFSRLPKTPLLSMNKHEGCSAADDVLERRDEKEDS